MSDAQTIWYLEVEVKYLKKNVYFFKDTWSISRYDNIRDITRCDYKTFHGFAGLHSRIYGSAYKSQREIIITKIKSKIPIGKVSPQ